jgi:hypothetical protein
VEHLFPDGNPIDGLEECYVEGDLEEYKVVSVPVTTTQRMQEEIKQTIQGRLNVPVMIISHNTAFLKAVKLSPNEAAKVIKKGEDYAEAYTLALEDYQTAKRGVGINVDVEGNGGGSGVGFDGSRGPGKSTGREGAVSGTERDTDKEGGQEGSTKLEGDS